MSLSDDPTSPTEKIRTSTRQEPRKTLQENWFLDSEETGMSLSDVPIPSQTSTTQEEPRESHQDSSFLQSKETETRCPDVSLMNIDEEAFKSLHCSFSENPIYHESDSITATATMNTGNLLNSGGMLGGNLFNGNQSNFSLDYGSQRSSLIEMIPTPGFVKSSTNNNNNNGQSCLNVEASNNSGDYGTDITDPFGSGSLFSGVTSVGMMTNTQNTDPASFQSVSTTSSSLFQQQPDQFHQQQQQQFLHQILQLKQQMFQPQRLISHDAFGKNQVASDMVNPFESIYSQTPEQFQLSQFQNQYQNNAEDPHDVGSQILPVTSQSFINSQQIQQMLDLQNMGSDSSNSFSNLSVGVRSESGLHGHSQSQSQGYAQMSNGMSNERHIQEEIMSGTDEAQPNNMSGGSIIGNLFNGNQSNFSLDYGWNMGSQRNTELIKMIPTPAFVKSNTNNNNNGQSYLSVEASNNSGGYGTNTQNNPASFQPVSTTSSSLPHQQQQFQQHGVLTEPHWTKKKILTLSDIGSTFILDKFFVEKHIRKHLPKEDGQKILQNGPGITVKVYDHDTYTTHELCLALRQTYILKKGWKNEFVVRRGLHKGEQIGLFWDRSYSKLHFSVLSRAIPKAPAEKKKLSIQ